MEVEIERFDYNTNKFEYWNPELDHIEISDGKMTFLI